MSHIPEGIATQDGRTPATPNPGYCACMSEIPSEDKGAKFLPHTVAKAVCEMCASAVARRPIGRADLDWKALTAEHAKVMIQRATTEPAVY